jgi:hypothetical protein
VQIQSELGILGTTVCGFHQIQSRCLWIPANPESLFVDFTKSRVAVCGFHQIQSHCLWISPNPGSLFVDFAKSRVAVCGFRQIQGRYLWISPNPGSLFVDFTKSRVAVCGFHQIQTRLSGKTQVGLAKPTSSRHRSNLNSSEFLGIQMGLGTLG